MCCSLSPTDLNPKPVNWTRFAGYTALVTGIALAVFAGCLAAGHFTPGVQAHISNYFAAGLAVFSVIPLSVAASILTQQNRSVSSVKIDV